MLQNPKNTLLIRADAGKKLGTGHVMQMLALAQAWISDMPAELE